MRVGRGPPLHRRVPHRRRRTRLYRPRRHPISSLAIGDRGWAQTANFFVAGLLSLAFAVGLWRAGPSHWGALLVGVWAIGMVTGGIFPTDPVSGFPPGTPDRLEHSTRQGVLHSLFSMVAFVALTAACFVFAGSGARGWAIYPPTRNHRCPEPRRDVRGGRRRAVQPGPANS
ncbi:DUF998 domain-containing protein [Microbispora rosea]|uniref:DUF998 domain-containing protein n=1 Tax=Microbispora rosea TaxID=58117 RepID=UPI0009F90449